MKHVAILASVVGLVSAGVWAGARVESPRAASPKASAETLAKFEQIKSLAGVWQMPGDGEMPGASVIYRVTSGGTAVAEHLMAGTDHEMVTMYHLDGDSIVATHYCSLGNQPRMRSRTGGGENTIAFEFQDCTNLMSAGDPHIHDLTLTFVDENHVNAAWKSYADGKPSEHSPVFECERVTDAAAAREIVVAAMTKLGEACCDGGGACCEGGTGECCAEGAKAEETR
ncbi:MAG: hypothetical protein H6811_05135 [Phycisphaeraceae bacterium]|nr:hypothetical protein [Phycisphaeraceae bacterium]